MSVKVFVDAALRDSVAGNATGLLLGTSQPHVRVVHAVATPPPPSRTAAHKWALEHARELAAMLPGGLYVLGAFAPLGPGGSAAAAAAVDAAAAIARRLPDVLHCPQPLVLFAAPGDRLAAKIVLSARDGLKTAALRELPRLANGLVSLRGAFDLAPMLVPFPPDVQEDPAHAETVCAQLLEQRFRNALIRIDAHKPYVVAPGTHLQTTLAAAMNWPLVETAKKKTPSFTRQESLQVRLYLPLHTSQQQQQPLSPATQAVSLSGRFCFEAVVMQDAPLSHVLHAVQHDLCTSLQARLQLLRDTNPHPESTPPNTAPSSRPLPVRVVATPLQNASLRIPFCDYIISGDTIQDDVMHTFAEILSCTPSTLDQYSIQQMEQHASSAPPVKQVAFNDQPTVIAPSSMTALDAAAKAPSDIMVNAIILAVLVAILAIIFKEFILHFL